MTMTQRSPLRRPPRPTTTKKRHKRVSRNRHLSRNRQFWTGKLPIIAFLAMSGTLLHMVSWLSTSIESQQEKSKDPFKPHDRRTIVQNAPTPRNSLFPRREYRSITNYDRQQDIHRYNVMSDKPRVVTMASPVSNIHSSYKVDPISSFIPPNNTVSYIFDFERPYNDECSPMEPWQTTFYPTCNTLHEVQALHLLSTRGSWRTVWMTEDQDVVMKILNLNRHFDTESFHYHQVDAMAMERLTRSKHVVHSFGFCGQSVLVEFAPNDGRELIKNKRLSSYGKLLIGRDLARGMADIHSIDAPKSRNVTLVHNDVNIANIVSMKSGRIKWSDFNIAYPLKWNKTRPCGYPQRWQNVLWRSPEEIINATYVSEKTDVYSLGNLLFQIMTRHQPWTWLEPKGRPSLEEIATKKSKGKTPFVPTKFRNSSDISVQALYQAIQSCFVFNPEKRASSYQVAYGLTQALKWMDEGNTTIRITRDLFFH